MFLFLNLQQIFAMKKWILLIVVLLVAGLVTYKLVFSKEEQKPEIKDKPLIVGKNSGAFNEAFGGLLDQYFALRDALVDWDTVKADKAAYALSQKADSLPVKLLKADTNVVATAASLAASVGGEAKGLVGEGDIAQKRKGFNMLTDELYNLIRTVRYNGETIYHMRCPMAFNDSEEGYWLSNSSTIINPYLGKHHPKYKETMIGCGEVTDSVKITN